MGFISLPLEDVKEPEVVPDGNYDLRIIKAEDGRSKAGNDMTSIMIKVEDDRYPDAQVIRHWLTYPDEDTPKDQRYLRLLDIKRFLLAFGIPYEKGFESEDLVGATGKCLVYQEEGDDGNIYNRLRLPRLDKKSNRGRD